MFVDKSTLSGIQYLNILGGSIEISRVSYFYDCQSLRCVSNSNSIAQAVDDAVRSLKINRNSFCHLLSNAANYGGCRCNTKISISYAASGDLCSTFIAQICNGSRISL